MGSRKTYRTSCDHVSCELRVYDKAALQKRTRYIEGTPIQPSRLHRI
jgi:hypothetical protein